MEETWKKHVLFSYIPSFTRFLALILNMLWINNPSFTSEKLLAKARCPPSAASRLRYPGGKLLQGLPPGHFPVSRSETRSIHLTTWQYTAVWHLILFGFLEKIFASLVLTGFYAIINIRQNMIHIRDQFRLTLGWLTSNILQPSTRFVASTVSLKYQEQILLRRSSAGCVHKITDTRG